MHVTRIRMIVINWNIHQVNTSIQSVTMIMTIGRLQKRCTLLKEREYKFLLTLENRTHLKSMKCLCLWKEMAISCTIALIKLKLKNKVVVHVFWFWKTLKMVNIISNITFGPTKSMILKSPSTRVNTGKEIISWNKMNYFKLKTNKNNYWSKQSVSKTIKTKVKWP